MNNIRISRELFDNTLAVLTEVLVRGASVSVKEKVAHVQRQLIEVNARPMLVLLDPEGTAVTAEQLDEIKETCRSGKVIASIKLLRTYTGIGLKDAKAIVDAHRQEWEKTDGA